jgi:hypothetical protein
MGLRNGDKYILWGDNRNPSDLLGLQDWESDSIDELYDIGTQMLRKKDGCGELYTLYIEDRYLEDTVEVMTNIP